MIQGDELRRSNNYFGVSGNVNSPVVDGSTIDGITMDFNTNHYVKMNLLGRTVTNFDQFDALSINNLPPVDFEFNAYYGIIRLKIQMVIQDLTYMVFHFR
jgi:hypothetical protein